MVIDYDNYILVRNAMQRILRYFIVFLSFFLFLFFFFIVEKQIRLTVAVLKSYKQFGAYEILRN